ncbi:hypothetical protein CHO01_17310 [Cellulomonas hominis]|uniref:Uncharacterized protein n=1 Tax=Cellulomonas hominis TaxID=156981 RepID=A0A511FBL4_9CELL|nr:hypothetical protein [Cellulomonas hominis]MBB5474576.1 hypothetical protein [Cellulomonas hominis]NKY05586.1 hypothetical protein [Cellulomonas hominis]GEL46615.1 hypothetical protein CHO01_17310 [Cellulomonas hominis]
MSPSPATRATRVPAGVRAGGQFATEARDEAPMGLLATQQEMSPDEDGFPTVLCARCQGSGKSLYNRDAGHSRCFACNGLGRRYPRGPVADAIAQFSKARTAAARPQAWQVRAGDVVSPIYEGYGQAKWGVVEKVLVARGRPVRFEGEGENRRPTAWAALLVLDDGRRLQVTTDTVLARRASEVDPAPFVEMALAGE